MGYYWGIISILFVYPYIYIYIYIYDITKIWGYYWAGHEFLHSPRCYDVFMEARPGPEM